MRHAAPACDNERQSTASGMFYGLRWIVFLSFSSLVWSADTTEAPAVALARILAAKGAITAAELSSITGAATDKVGALASILERKGLLTPAEVAQFYPAPPTVAAA